MPKKILDETKKARPFTITMDLGIIERIDREAGNFHLSRSSWLKLAAINEIRRRQKEQEVLLQGSGTATNHGTLTTSTTTVDGDGLQHNNDSS
jgi:hypothetical protein